MTRPLNHCRINLHRPDFHLEVDFDLPEQGVLCVFGESGAGKTTLLRAIAGLEQNLNGELIIAGETWVHPSGKATPPHQRPIGYVFQDHRLFPHLNVRDNLRYGLKRRNTRHQAITFDEVIELLDLSLLLERRSWQLSGGEAQRVSMGRALLSQPKLLLMDEPLASLDAKRKQAIFPFLERLTHNISIPIIYVSHQMDEIQRLGKQLLVLNKGKQQFHGSMKDALISTHAPFVHMDRASTLLDGEVVSYDAQLGVSSVSLTRPGLSSEDSSEDSAKNREKNCEEQKCKYDQLLVAAKLNTQQKISLQILASDVSLSLSHVQDSSILNILPGTITHIIYRSEHHAMLLVDVGGQAILARISLKSFYDLGLSLNQSVYVQIKAVSIHKL